MSDLWWLLGKSGQLVKSVLASFGIRRRGEADAERVRARRKKSQREKADRERRLEGGTEPAFQTDENRKRSEKSLRLDAAYNAYCEEIERGNKVSDSEFCERYPDIKSSLWRQLDVHKAVVKQCQEDESKWPETGAEFLDFTILQELGTGAFARVYLAREPLMGNRLVALKVAWNGGLEAETLGKLEHENIVPAYSVNEDYDSAMSAIVMPYRGRATLLDLLDLVHGSDGVPQRASAILESVEQANTEPEEGEWTGEADPQLTGGTYLDGVLHMGAQLAEGLDHAHDQGIFHLDLKPSNVLVARDGTPMLLDFNLSHDEKIGSVGVGGTLLYMAPEQLAAIADPNCTEADVDRRSDIFSLGVLLFELLGGELPFGDIPVGTSTEIAQQLLDRYKSGATSLRALNPVVSESVAKIVGRCLAFDPDERIQTATELASLLRAELTGVRRAKRWVRNHLAVSTATAAAVLIMTTWAGALWAGRDPYHLRQYKAAQAAYERGDYQAALEHSEKSLRAAPDSLESSDVIWLRLHASIETGDFGGAGRELDQLLKRGTPKEELNEFANEQVPLGGEAYLKKEYKIALEHFQLAHAANDASAPIHIWLARTLEKLGDYHQAVRFAATAEKLSDDVNITALRAYCSNKARIPALGTYYDAVDRGLDSAILYNNMAHACLQLGRRELAKVYIEDAIRRDPDLPSAYFLRMKANINEAMSDESILAAVIDDVWRALELTKDEQGKGQMLRDLAMLCGRAAEFDPSHAPAAVRYARMALKSGATADDLRGYPRIWSLLEDQIPDDQLRGDSTKRHLFDMQTLMHPIESVYVRE